MLRSLYVLALVGALTVVTACHAKHAPGAFAAQGVAAGELAKGDLVYSCWESDGGRCNYAGVVCGLGPTSARICATAHSTEGRTLTLAQLIPEKRLAPGMLLEDGTSRAWLPITRRYSDGLGVDEEGHSIPWRDVIVVTETAQANDHHERWFNTIAGALLTVLAIGMLVLARHLQKRANVLESAADIGDDDDNENAKAKDKATAAAAAAPAAADSKLDVLRCDACATPIKLIAEPQTVCPGCNKQIAIPPAYVDLVQKQRYIAEHLPGQAAALRRAQLMANPLVAVLMLAAGYGSWKGFGWIMGHMTGGTDAAFWVVTAFPLFYLPVGCLVAAIGQLVGGRVLARAVPQLAAVKDATGYACRGCGAPLGATQDGIAEVCVYCGVQNLISARVAASDAAASRTARALRQTLGAASAGFWYRFDRLFVPPLYVAGVIGLILYPFILVVGLTS